MKKKTNPKKESGELSPQRKLERLSRIVFASVGVAAFCTMFALFSLVSSHNQVSRITGNLTPVLVAKQEIPTGSTIQASMLEITQVPAAYVSSDILSNMSQAIGSRACVKVPAGAQITTSLISGDANRSSLSGQLGKGKRAVSISVDDESGLSGLLTCTDRVNVYAGKRNTGTRSTVLAKNVKVQALDDSLGETPENGYSTVTLEVNQTQARRIREAQLSGYTLSLDLQPKSEE